MKLLKMTVDGFLSYGIETVVDFTELGYCSFIGLNGSGKSSLPQAIAWTLYGRCRVGSDGDSVINSRCEQANVDIEFMVNDEEWGVVRNKTRGGNQTVALYYRAADGVEWVRYGDHRNSTATEKLAELLRLGEDAFFSLVLLDQSSTAGGNKFTNSDAATRRHILREFLPELDHWSGLYWQADESLTECRAEITRLAASRDTLQGTLEDLDEKVSSAPQSDPSIVDGLNKEIEAVRTKREAIETAADEADDKSREKVGILRSSLREQNNHLQLATDTVSRLRTAIEVIRRTADVEPLDFDPEKEIPALEAEKSNVQADLHDEVSELEQGIANAQTLMDKVKNRRSRAAVAVETAKDNLTQIEEADVCWVCGTPFSSEQGQKVVSELKGTLEAESAMIDKADRKLADVTKSIRDLRDKITTLRGDATEQTEVIQGELNRLKERVREVARATDAVKGNKLMERGEADLKEELQATTETMKALSARIEGIEADITEQESAARDAVKEAQVEGRRMTQLIEANERAIREASKGSGQVETWKTLLASTREQVEGIDAQIIAAESQKDDLELLREAYSSSGVPSMLMTDLLRDIEHEQNALLAGFPDGGRMQVEFRLTRPLKSRDGTKDVLDLVVHTDDGERLIESFSFGERVKLTITNLFAIVKVLSRRTGTSIRTMILDEPLGPLDADNIPVLVNLLRDSMAENLLDTLIVVTHDERVIEALPQTVRFQKDSNGNTVMEIAA